jgi:hypothetical protein
VLDSLVLEIIPPSRIVWFVIHRLNCHINMY